MQIMVFGQLTTIYSKSGSYKFSDSLGFESAIILKIGNVILKILKIWEPPRVV